MILIKPERVYKGIYKYICRNNPAGFIFLYDMDYNVYSLEAEHRLKIAGKLHPETRPGYNTVSFHPADKKAAVILKDSSLAVCTLKADILWQKSGSFVCLMYSRDGSHIWTIEKLSKDYLRISVFDSISGSLLNSREINDVLYDSTPRISDIPDSDNVILELAAGQDGISLFECIYTDKIELAELFPCNSYITPAWSSDKNKIITLENDAQTYAHFSCPEYKLLSEQTDIDFDNEESIPGYNMIYLKNGLAVVQNINYRHFLFDPVKWERHGEIAFYGYEPVPACQIYKNLKDDSTLCSRIVYFDRIGNILAAQTGDKDNDPVIVFINEDEFISQIEQNKIYETLDKSV